MPSSVHNTSSIDDDDDDDDDSGCLTAIISSCYKFIDILPPLVAASSPIFDRTLTGLLTLQF